jgi:hypothetical protein
MGKSIFKNNAKNYILFEKKRNCIVCENNKKNFGVIIEDRLKNIITVVGGTNNNKDIKK